jgi:DNA polymerase III delta prime subunit
LNCEEYYCEEKYSPPTVGDSHVIRMNKKDYHAYCIFICNIGELFFTAQQLQSEGALDGPYRATIVLPKVETYDKHGVQPEDNLTRIKFLLNSFVPPEKGIIVTLCEHWQEKHIMTPYGTFWLWPYKRQWKKENTENYVAVQSVKEIVDHKAQPDIVEIHEKVIKELDDSKIQYKLVGYHLTIEELFDTLLKSKMLLTATSCSYYIAGGLNVPTIAYGKRNAQTDSDTVKNFTAWGNTFLSNAKLIHYDEANGIHNRPQNYITNIGEVKTDKEYNILRSRLMNEIY